MTAYATIEEASIYFATRMHTEAWDNTPDVPAGAAAVTRGKALNHATMIIDRLNFMGDKTDSSQVNQFPRGGDTTIAQDIKDACCEIALSLLDGINPDLEFENLSLTHQAFSTVKSTYDRSVVTEHIAAGVPSVQAWRLLKPYLRDAKSLRLSRV